MSTHFDIDFEGTYPPTNWSEAGTVANIGTSTVQARGGVTSLRVNSASAASAWIANTALVDGMVHVMRVYIRIATAPSGTVTWYQLDNTAGTIYLRLTSGRIARVTLNTTNFDGPTLNLGQWYRWDIRATTSGATTTVDWQIDSVAQTQATRSQAAANMTAAYIGIITSSTHDIYFDDLKATDTSGDYPLTTIVGTFVNALPELAFGTGAAHQAAATVKPTAGQGTGTGMTWQGITGELVLASIPASGYHETLQSIADIRVAPDADPAAGTGAGYTAGKSLKPIVGHAAGGGAAYNSATFPKATAEIASGLGAAANAVPQGIISAVSGSASGTGAGLNAAPITVSGSSEPGLTLQMGMS